MKTLEEPRLKNNIFYGFLGRLLTTHLALRVLKPI